MLQKRNMNRLADSLSCVLILQLKPGGIDHYKSN